MGNVRNRFEHVFYEIQMYLAAYDNYSVPIEQKQLLINLLVDSRAIHLRNLAYFFKKEKHGQYWHAGDFVSDIDSVNLIEDTLFNDIKEYSSRATCHLLDYRLDESYKQNTGQCFKNAFPVMINAINSFLVALETRINPDVKEDFEEADIQVLFKRIKGKLSFLSVN